MQKVRTVDQDQATHELLTMRRCADGNKEARRNGHAVRVTYVDRRARLLLPFCLEGGDVRRLGFLEPPLLDG
jgi:hypothetical protein